MYAKGHQIPVAGRYDRTPPLDDFPATCRRTPAAAPRRTSAAAGRHTASASSSKLGRRALCERLRSERGDVWHAAPLKIGAFGNQARGQE